MSLEVGRRLGPYEIQGSLGAGGMGQVYRARDTRLERTVAIKVLPPHLAADEQARQRLEREARAVSGLSHPHICTLYDVGHEDGVEYLVIEYFEGETLAERLQHGAMPLDELLATATQIASALDHAHRQGMIHRDLKPGNVMMTASGAKLLDFGLAKSVAEPPRALDLTAPPTATSPLTAQGTIVGTFQYMSPEQVEGKEADARSDVFAFGAVLYEMATGRKAFQGDTQASLIASIMERMPEPIAAVQSVTPPALDRLVRTCLAKNPDERRQTMRGVLLELRFIAEDGSEADVPAPVTRRRRSRARLAWSLAAVFALTAAALAGVLLTTIDPVPAPRVLAYLPSPDGERLPTFPGGHLAVSPDGSMLAFCAMGEGQETRLWVRSLATGESRVLHGTEGAWFPFWSPDGRSIGFFTGGALKRVDVQGGTPLTLSPVTDGFGGTWGEGDVILFTTSQMDVLYRLPASGGTPAPVTEAQDGASQARHRFPWFLPGGQHFLYTSLDDQSGAGGIRAGSIDGTTDRPVIDVVSNAAFSDGKLYFTRENTLIAQRFDPGLLKVEGPEEIVADPVFRYGEKAAFSVARGLVAFIEPRPSLGSQLTWYERDGAVADTLFSEGSLDDISVSHDGRYVAVARDELDAGGDNDIWTLDTGRRVFTRVTFQGTADDPAWSPDDRWIAYAFRGNIFRKRANGAGEREALYESQEDKVLQEWTPDGKKILFQRLGRGGEGVEDISVLDLETGEAESVLESPFREIHADLSPDGNWLAYASDESGVLQVYVMSWPDLTGKWQVSREGGSMPRWRGDGRELYFMSRTRQIMAVPVEGRDDRFEIGDPVALFNPRLEKSWAIRTHQYVASADGQRFLVLERPEGVEDRGGQFTLVLGH